MVGPCDCCLLHMQFPDLSKRTYSMGCNYCAARYLRDGGETDIATWECYGINVKEAYTLKAEGVFVDPELKRRKR